MSTRQIVFVLFIIAVILGLIFYYYKNTSGVSTTQDREIFYQLLSENKTSDWPLEITNQTPEFAEGIYGSGAVIDWVAKKDERGEWALVYKLLLDESVCNHLINLGVPEYFNTIKRCHSQFSL